MVIGFDASRAFISHRTGTENYSFQILSHLAKIDQENQYLVFLPPKPVGFEPKIWPKNFHFQIIPWPRLWTQGGLAKTLFQTKLDVLFVPAHTLPLLHPPHLKTVITVHDLGAEYLPKTHQIKQRLYLHLMTNYQLHSATHLIAVSEATKKDLVQKIRIKPEKITVISEGYNQKLFKPVKDNILTKVLHEFNLTPNGYFLYVGTIQPRKNLVHLITAFAQYQKATPNHLKLVLTGSKGWLADDIYLLPSKLKIQDQVKFLGYVEDQKLPALYSGARAFVFPSLFEGFGLPVLEAFACGCPVLTSNTSSLPEVADQAALLVDPYSEEEIKIGLEKLTQDATLRKQLIKKGFDQVKKFSWDKAAQTTLTVLLRVAKS